MLCCYNVIRLGSGSFNPWQSGLLLSRVISVINQIPSLLTTTETFSWGGWSDLRLIHCTVLPCSQDDDFLISPVTGTLIIVADIFVPKTMWNFFMCTVSIEGMTLKNQPCIRHTSLHCTPKTESRRASHWYFRRNPLPRRTPIKCWSHPGFYLNLKSLMNVLHKLAENLRNKLGMDEELSARPGSRPQSRQGPGKAVLSWPRPQQNFNPGPGYWGIAPAPAPAKFSVHTIISVHTIQSFGQ